MVRLQIKDIETFFVVIALDSGSQTLNSQTSISLLKTLPGDLLALQPIFILVVVLRFESRPDEEVLWWREAQ